MKEILMNKNRWFILPVFMVFLLFSNQILAQEKQMFQVKTFDQELQPYRDISISINGNDFIAMGSKGLAFVELSQGDLPIKSILINDKKLEAASWNRGKGIIEVIIRKKSYHIFNVLVKGKDNMPMANQVVGFRGKKVITATTNSRGVLELPLALDEDVNSTSQFKIEGFNVLNLKASGDDVTLTVEPIIVPQVAEAEPVLEEPEQQPEQEVAPVLNQEYFQDFDLAMLDSIESLTVFYAVFKNYNIEELDEDVKAQVDAKFNELVGQLQDSLNNNSAVSFIENISESSYVQDDIDNLLSQAQIENRMLDAQQSDFQEKIEIIKGKLEGGVENMNENTRESLLKDLNLLERLLTENESRFYRNQSRYHQIINSLKETFFDFEDLENKLSLSEAQRLEEQRIFRQRLFATLAIILVFAILIILLIYVSSKLKKQKKQLVIANGEVQRINENLEAIVSERTQLLKETNKELDMVLYRASHDLRSPVCSIVGLCNIATTVSGPESNELLEKVVQTTSKMDRLLKKLSIISAINKPSELSPIVLSQVVENIRQEFNEIIVKHGITFEVNCPADLTIYSYQYLIEIILTNLIENALYYCIMKRSDEYKVALTATMKEDYLELILFDNGIGIDDKISDKLFEMFFRGNERSKGNGLGLYIVQKSITALHGSVKVESEPGQFTKFVVELPLQDVGEEILILES